MSKLYKCLPSEILGIEDTYTAFCFDEACCNLMLRIENEEEPRYIEQNKNGEQKLEYSSFTDFYKQYGQTE